MNNRQWDFLDCLSILAFFIGLANYNENVSQGQMQDAITQAVKDVHEHLKDQDEKLSRLLGEANDDNSRDI